MFRDTLFSTPFARVIEPVETEAGTTYVRQLTLGEKEAYALATEGGKSLPTVNLLIACVCREDGTPEFTAADTLVLAALPAGLMDPVIMAAIKINKFTQQDQEALRKNS